MTHKRYVDFISGSALDALIRGKAREITVGGTSAGNAIQVNALQKKEKKTYICPLLHRATSHLSTISSLLFCIVALLFIIHQFYMCIMRMRVCLCPNLGSMDLHRRQRFSCIHHCPPRPLPTHHQRLHRGWHIERSFSRSTASGHR